MSKIKKIISTLLLIIIIAFLYGSNLYATDIITGADDFIQSGISDGISDSHPTIDESDLKAMSDLLYNALLVIAIVIAVIVGLVVAIQFITGSVAQKAKVKETLIPYIAGCIVIFGAFGIWKLVVGILSQTQ